MARKKRISTITTKTFSERLSELVNTKKRTGLSQKEIATQLNLSSGTLSEWCSDNVTPPIDVLPGLAEYFNVSTDWLLGLSDVMSRNEDIQFIHNKTALSQEAISKLTVDKYIGDNEYIPLLNRIVESDLFSEFAALANTYIRIHEDSSLRIDMNHLGLDEVSLKTSAFIKAVLTDYLYRILDDK